MDQTTSQAYERARERVQLLRSFYITLTLYIVVNTGLFVLDMLTTSGPWFFWPLLGWGIGMIAFALKVFGPTYRIGSDWEARKIREYLDRERIA